MFSNPASKLIAKPSHTREIYALIQARDFERAQALIIQRSVDAGHDADYYKSLAKIAALQEDYAYALNLYEKSIAASGSGTQRFLVYGDVIRLLYLTGREADAQRFVDSAIEDLMRVMRRPILTAHSIVHLSMFALRLGVAGVYIDLLTAQWCWNPWQAKLKLARQALASHRDTLEELRVLQANEEYCLTSLKSPVAEQYDSVTAVVFLPMNYLSLLLRDFEGTYDYYNTILSHLEQKKVRFVLKNQYALNLCPERSPSKVLSWHTYGRVEGVRHLKESPFPGFFYFDQTGYSGWSEIAAMSCEQIEKRLSGIPNSEAEAYSEALVERFIRAGKSKYDQSKPSSGNLPRRYVFIPMQLLDDHVTKLTDWDIFRLIQSVLDWLHGTEVSLVLKRHPKCLHWRVDAFLTEMVANPDVLLVDAPIHELIQGALAVCTVNSGVGAEALLMGKSVFTASPTDYGFLSHDVRYVRSAAEFMTLIEAEVDHLQYAKFMTFYCRDYLVDASDPEVIKQRVDDWLDAAC